MRWLRYRLKYGAPLSRKRWKWADELYRKHAEQMAAVSQETDPS